MAARALVLLLGCILSVAASAQPAPATTVPLVWHCWYERAPAYVIRCHLPSSPETELDADPVAFAFPDRTLDIPIYGPPISGEEFSRRLAHAAMCGRRPDCAIVFDARFGASPAMMNSLW